MYALVFSWLQGLNVNPNHLDFLSHILVILFILLAAYLLKQITKMIICKWVRDWVDHTESFWDDVFFDSNFFFRMAYYPPLLLLYLSRNSLPNWSDWIQRFTLALIAVVTAWVIEAAFTSVNEIYEQYEVSKSKPIKGYMQFCKIILWFFTSILIIAALMKSSPILLLGGLSAFSAVLLLVFKDTLLGLFASIQFASNDMVHIGDWIEVPAYGASGEVIDISVHTIKISNRDKTISTVPTYDLMSNSFKNWRGVQLFGGRLIKRALHINLHAIQLCDENLLTHLLEKGYLANDLFKQLNCPQENQQTQDSCKVKGLLGHEITNLSAFRAYLLSLLRNHPDINQEADIIVRALEPTANGIPIEVIAFCNQMDLQTYEDIQADIFDHLLAVLPEFGLSAYQNPSSVDIRSLGLR